eukprot:scaffold277447_cov43-Tisochrysis_lutea.AAC.1
MHGVVGAEPAHCWATYTASPSVKPFRPFKSPSNSVSEQLAQIGGDAGSGDDDSRGGGCGSGTSNEAGGRGTSGGATL